MRTFGWNPTESELQVKREKKIFERGWSLFTHWRTMVCWKTGDVWMNGDCRFNLLIMIEKGHRRVFFRFWPWLWNTEGSIYIMMWKKSLQFQVLYISQFTTLLSQLNNNHNPMQLGWDYHRHSPTITVSLVTKKHSVLIVCGWGGLVPTPLLISSRMLVTNRQTIRLVF